MVGSAPKLYSSVQMSVSYLCIFVFKGISANLFKKFLLEIHMVLWKKLSIQVIFLNKPVLKGSMCVYMVVFANFL